MNDLAVVPVDPMPGPLAKLEHARATLEQASTVDEVKDIRDKAEALRLYAKQADLGLEMQNHCAELKLRAERKAGEMLAAMDLKPGPKAAIDNTLLSIGVRPIQSSRWQRVALLPEDEFEAFINEAKAARRELTTNAALKLAKQLIAADKPVVDPPGHGPIVELDEYPVIVIDPPWQYDNTATRGAAEDHYPTMTLEDLAELELPSADNAHLYLWVTNSFLRQGFDLMDAWGFSYKTTLTWVKPQIGMGNWFRNSTEHVLFGVKGKLPTLRNNCPTWFQADRTRHSAKPECFYDLVESCSPGPYMEMFARRRRFGWHVWGNES